MNQEIDKPDSWKTQTYTLGAVLGMLFGFITAYLFTRAAEEKAEGKQGRPEKIKTMNLMSVSLAVLKLMRQIAELGQEGEKK